MNYLARWGNVLNLGGQRNSAGWSILIAQQQSARQALAWLGLIAGWKAKEHKKPNAGYSLDDPTADVKRYLRSEHKHRFSLRSWEGLYKDVLTDIPTIAHYMATKSAHFGRAFDLE